LKRITDQREQRRIRNLKSKGNKEILRSPNNQMMLLAKNQINPTEDKTKTTKIRNHKTLKIREDPKENQKEKSRIMIKFLKPLKIRDRPKMNKK